MKCLFCGNENDDDAIFCPVCGTTIKHTRGQAGTINPEAGEIALPGSTDCKDDDTSPYAPGGSSADRDSQISDNDQQNMFSYSQDDNQQDMSPYSPAGSQQNPSPYSPDGSQQDISIYSRQSVYMQQPLFGNQSGYGSTGQYGQNDWNKTQSGAGSGYYGSVISSNKEGCTTILVLGIISLALSLFWLMWLGSIAGLTVGIIGLVKSGDYRKKYGELEGKASLGTALSLAGVITGALLLVILLIFLVID